MPATLYMYKFDLENALARQASLAELLGYEYVMYDEIRQVNITLDENYKSGANYVLKNGVFTAK